MAQRIPPSVEALADRFHTAFGRRPAGIWAAPGRVNLIGEHTDYNEGFVLPMALGATARVAMCLRTDGRLRLVSAQFSRCELRLGDVRPGVPLGWPAYIAGALWAAAESGAVFTGADVLLDSSVPVGAGLSSSAAVECATMLAVAELTGTSRSAFELALLAHRAETQIVGVPCGIMDQTVSMCARAGHALLLDCRTREVAHLPLCLESAGLELLVVDTGVVHQLVDGEYGARRAACEAAAAALGVAALRDVTEAELVRARGRLTDEQSRRARHVVTENARVQGAVAALGTGDLDALGPMLNASHASLRDDFQVSVTELNVAQQRAVGAGALGARMVGAGFGGCVLVLIRQQHAQAVTTAIEESFRQHAYKAPRHYRVRPSRGAQRLA